METGWGWRGAGWRLAGWRGLWLDGGGWLWRGAWLGGCFGGAGGGGGVGWRMWEGLAGGVVRVGAGEIWVIGCEVGGGGGGGCWLEGGLAREGLLEGLFPDV